MLYKEIKCPTCDDHWFVDTNIPIFKDKDREYIEKLINFE